MGLSEQPVSVPAQEPEALKFYTTNEVAALLRHSPETLKYWRQQGEGPEWFRARPGRRILYPADAVNAWVKRLRSQGGAR